MPRRRSIRLLDTVALLEDLPERKLKRGEVGTVVEVLARNVYEVEFCDEEGQTYAELALRGDQLVLLHNRGEALRIVAQGGGEPATRRRHADPARGAIGGR